MIDLPLFDNPTPMDIVFYDPPAGNPRQGIIDATLERQGEAFRTAYEGFVVSYLASRGPMTNETIRNAYKKTALPQPEKWQAAGGVIIRLKRAGAIKVVGQERSKLYGNNLDVLAVNNDQMTVEDS